MTDKKLSIGDKLGYAIGAFGDTVPLNIFNFYFLFFLTDIYTIAGSEQMVPVQATVNTL